MSALIVEFRRIKDEISQLEDRLGELQADPEFAKEERFDSLVRALLDEYGKSLRDVIEILDPASVRRQSNRGQLDLLESLKPDDNRRGPRKVQTYKNPHTGEIVKSAGGNHKVLREWKNLYPHTDISSWKVKEA